MDYLKTNHLALLIIVFLVLSNIFTVPKLGAAPTTQFTATIRADAGIRIGGSSGTNLGLSSKPFIATTCNLIGSDASQAASTTKAYSCAVTGITSSHTVFAQLATSTEVVPGGQGGWLIQGAKASTTAGYATVLLYNYGPAASPSVTSVGSSTAILAF